jgi:cell division protease FtsH
LPDRDLAELAIMAERSTGAELMLVVREGRRIARHAGRPLAIADLSTALMPSGSSPARAVWRTAVHEAGHAVGALALPFGDLRRCVVAHRGSSAGHTLIEETDDDLPTLEHVRKRVTMLLCGRAAERVVLDAGSLGDQSDLAAATREIAAVHGAAGLGETIAYLGSGERLQDLLGTDRSLRRRVERDLRELGARAEVIVRRHRSAIVAVALELSGKRHLSGEAIRAIFARTPADAGFGPNEEDTAC